MKLHRRNTMLCFCYHSNLNSFFFRIPTQNPHGSSMLLYQQEEIKDLFCHLLNYRDNQEKKYACMGEADVLSSREAGPRRVGGIIPVLFVEYINSA